jgi:hypothetical protein
MSRYLVLLERQRIAGLRERRHGAREIVRRLGRGSDGRTRVWNQGSSVGAHVPLGWLRGVISMLGPPRQARISLQYSSSTTA